MTPSPLLMSKRHDLLSANPCAKEGAKNNMGGARKEGMG